MFGAILKATNSSFQKGMPFCRSIYVKKVMKLLAFIFEQPSYSICTLAKICLQGLLAGSAQPFIGTSWNDSNVCVA